VYILGKNLKNLTGIEVVIMKKKLCKQEVIGLS